MVATNAMVQKLIDMAKKAGLRELRVGDVHIVLAPPEPVVQEVDLSGLIDPTTNIASEDEVKFWSAGGSGFKDVKGEDLIPPLVGEEHG